MNKFVVAGGWSVSKIDVRDLHKLGDVIGVNDSAIRVPYAKTALSMDRMWFEHRAKELYEMRVPEVLVRQKCDCNVKVIGDVPFWSTFVHWNKPGLSPLPGELYGSNSGICAVNLAYQRLHRGDQLFLLGFDMCSGPNGESYWYPPYPWNPEPVAVKKPGYYRHWAKDFDAISTALKARGIHVYNVSSRTVLNQFPKITPKQMLELCRD